MVQFFISQWISMREDVELWCKVLFTIPTRFRYWYGKFSELLSRQGGIGALIPRSWGESVVLGVYESRESTGRFRRSRRRRLHFPADVHKKFLIFPLIREVQVGDYCMNNVTTKSTKNIDRRTLSRRPNVDRSVSRRTWWPTHETRKWKKGKEGEPCPRLFGS